MYLDDGIGFGQDFKTGLSISESVRLDLPSSGFVINERKSVLNPIHCLEWLGYSIGTVRFVLTISGRKLNKVRETGTYLFSVLRAKKTVSVGKVASFVGQIISMSTIIGSVCQLMTKCLSIDILNASSWNEYIRLSDDSVRQIIFWIDTIQGINVKTTTAYSCYIDNVEIFF
jgi:hypothetical protein